MLETAKFQIRTAEKDKSAFTLLVNGTNPCRVLYKMNVTYLNFDLFAKQRSQNLIWFLCDAQSIKHVPYEQIISFSLFSCSQQCSWEEPFAEHSGSSAVIQNPDPAMGHCYRLQRIRDIVVVAVCILHWFFTLMKCCSMNIRHCLLNIGYAWTFLKQWFWKYKIPITWTISGIVTTFTLSYCSW
jgi:hypothetical protein